MTAIADNSSLIQIEGDRFRSPLSESLMQAIGGGINYVINKIPPVGTYLHSCLTEAQFQGEVGNSTRWILSDGRSIVGSALNTLTGLTNAPDARGIILRSKNNGVATTYGNESGELALGTWEDHKVGRHTHQWYSTPGSVGKSYAINGTTQVSLSAGGTVGTLQFGTFSADSSALTGDYFTGIAIQQSGVNETAPRVLTVNIFIRIN